MRKCVAGVCALYMISTNACGWVVKLTNDRNAWKYRKKMIIENGENDTPEDLIDSICCVNPSSVILNSNSETMPGIEVYKNGDDVRVYVADKRGITKTEEQESKKQIQKRSDYAYTSFRKYSHTERQLVIAAIKDITSLEKLFDKDGNFKNDIEMAPLT